MLNEHLRIPRTIRAHGAVSPSSLESHLSSRRLTGEKVVEAARARAGAAAAAVAAATRVVTKHKLTAAAVRALGGGAELAGDLAAEVPEQAANAVAAFSHRLSRVRVGSSSPGGGRGRVRSPTLPVSWPERKMSGSALDARLVVADDADAAQGGGGAARGGGAALEAPRATAPCGEAGFDEEINQMWKALDTLPERSPERDFYIAYMQRLNEEACEVWVSPPPPNAASAAPLRRDHAGGQYLPPSPPGAAAGLQALGTGDSGGADSGGADRRGADRSDMQAWHPTWRQHPAQQSKHASGVGGGPGRDGDGGRYSFGGRAGGAAVCGGSAGAALSVLMISCFVGRKRMGRPALKSSQPPPTPPYPPPSPPKPAVTQDGSAA